MAFWLYLGGLGHYSTYFGGLGRADMGDRGAIDVAVILDVCLTCTGIMRKVGRFINRDLNRPVGTPKKRPQLSETFMFSEEAERVASNAC